MYHRNDKRFRAKEATDHDRMDCRRSRRFSRGCAPVSDRTHSAEGGFDFPIKTLAVNLLGAFAIGLITALAAKHPDINPRLILFLKTGICGGFTTFSTFALETGNLMQAGHPVLAVLYVVLSLLLGIAAVFAGQMLVKPA